MWTPFVQMHPKIIIKYVSLKNSHSFDSILQLNWKPFMRTPPLKTILAQNTAALGGHPSAVYALPVTEKWHFQAFKIL